MIAIINAKILTVTNGTIENGALLIEDGKIKAYGENIAIPENAEIIDAKGGWLTPGFIDAHTHMCVFGEPNTMPGLQNDGNEGSSPITPELDAINALNPHDMSIEKVRNAGFTTCYTGPGSANVIGGTGVTFKLRGNSPEEMEIPGHRHMKMALGENPKRFYGTNKKVAPWTRMGTGALLRKWLQMAKNYSDELIAFEKGEGKKPNWDFQLEALVPVVRGEMKARIHAHRADDIHIQNRRGLINAVRRSEGDGERIHARSCNEIRGQRGLCIKRGGICRDAARAALSLGQRTELRLHVHAVRVRIVHDRPRIRCVFLIGKRGAIDHNRGKAHIDRALQVFNILAVIEMHADLHATSFSQRQHRRADICERRDRLVQLHVRNDHGHVQRLCRLQHRRQAFEIRRIERTDGNAARLALCKDLLQANTHLLASSISTISYPR